MTGNQYSFVLNPTGIFSRLLNHLGIRTDDLDSLVKHIQAHGVMFRKTITEAESFRYVMCEAPDGVLLELYQVKEGGEWMVGQGSQESS